MKILITEYKGKIWLEQQCAGNFFFNYNGSGCKIMVSKLVLYTIANEFLTEYSDIVTSYLTKLSLENTYNKQINIQKKRYE